MRSICAEYLCIMTGMMRSSCEDAALVTFALCLSERWGAGVETHFQEI